MVRLGSVIRQSGPGFAACFALKCEEESHWSGVREKFCSDEVHISVFRMTGVLGMANCCCMGRIAAADCIGGRLENGVVVSADLWLVTLD